MLRGGGGADTFLFEALADSGKKAGKRDLIEDFKSGQGDVIDLHLIDANSKKAGDQAFSFIRGQDFHEKAGELRFEKKNGDTLLYGDVNGDGKADFSIEFAQALNLKAADFIL